MCSRSSGPSCRPANGCSPGDRRPVARAGRRPGEHAAIARRRDDGRTRAFLDRGFPRPLSQAYQAYPIRKQRVVHYPTCSMARAYPENMRQMARDISATSSKLIAPLLWNGARHQHDPHHAPAANTLHRTGCRAAEELRRAGGDRDPERAAVQRNQGGAGATDRQRRGAAGDQRIGGRRPSVFDKILESCSAWSPART